MAKSLTIREFLALDKSVPAIDVRSEGEFLQGHIPGAISLPLFNNAERAEIGTLYKKTGRREAILRGLQFAGVRMHEIAATALSLASGGKIAVHCWRGGMRSGSVAWLLERVGLEVNVLAGGYKSYRRLCLELFAFPWRLRVIGGKTGSQKTRILHDLKASGQNTIDLEAMANHRGSAFGYAASGEQPTQEQFENDLGMELFPGNAEKPVFVEDESRMIGRMHVPDLFWKRMRTSPVYVVEWPTEIRINYLVSVYDAPPEKMRENLKAISKRLGMERYKNAVMALDEGNMSEFCRIVLDYYDRAYSYGLSQRDPRTLTAVAGEAAVREILAKV